MKYLARILHLFIIILLLIFLSSCSDDSATNVVDIESGDGPATITKRIARTNEFTFNLYQELKSSENNLIISPHSIVTCFGMAYAGARGNTEKQIADVLCFNYPQAGFHSVLKNLNSVLVSQPEVDLRISNGCWGRDNLVYKSSYLDTLSENYSADIEYLDFVNQPEQARQAINLWANNNTSGMISELLPPGAIDALTYLVLTNTVYFIAEWLHPFDPGFTYNGPFKKLDGSNVDVPFMNGEEVMPYYEGNGYLAVELPYKGEQLSMLLIMPDEGEFGNFEDAFNLVVLDSVVKNLVETDITFRIPSFKFSSGFNLNNTLKNLGLTDAFTPGVANFSGMDGIDNGIPWIDLVAHESYIWINEYGTFAFAGTGMVLTYGMHDSFNATRPFIFIIRDIPTGTILFMGRVLDPSM